MSDEKQRWPAELALEVATELAGLLMNPCARIAVAGSLRRGRPEVGDLELLYIPKFDEAKLPGEMFAQGEQNLADLAIGNLIAAGVLEKRLNAKGHEAYGEKNKLMRHRRTGLPVDLFATTESCWANYLVCRTGGMKTNIAICEAARARGWTWRPYGPGFSRRTGGTEEWMAVTEERQVFEFIGLPYAAPAERE